MIYITFNGISSRDMGVYWKSSDRSLLPVKRVVRYEIPGRDGYYEADTDTYDNRLIAGIISFMGAERDFLTLRTKARAVAQWLSGSGQLIFSDEPDKAYQAKVISGIPLEQLARAGSCSVAFDCQPFAEALTYTEQSAAAATLPHAEMVNVQGLAPTPCIIKITAKSAISGTLTITRKVES